MYNQLYYEHVRFSQCESHSLQSLMYVRKYMHLLGWKINGFFSPLIYIYKSFISFSHCVHDTYIASLQYLADGRGLVHKTTKYL